MNREMKTINLIKIAAVVLLGIALNEQAYSDKDKYSRSGRPAFGHFTHTVKLTGDDIRGEPVEGWMFKLEYLSEESAGSVEPWMLETNYLDEAAQPLESWMFSESRLSEDNSGNVTESWMFDLNYLSK
ncbi:MAG: hypothetical protein D4R64_08630 [Porphyromonadaceae bacterium]|nr:MAG: hypothetical protein D4R64_08630 [Porphyromonadaceae bacterium]